MGFSLLHSKPCFAKKNIFEIIILKTIFKLVNCFGVSQKVQNISIFIDVWIPYSFAETVIVSIRNSLIRRKLCHPIF